MASADDAVDNDEVRGGDREGQPSRSRSENIIMWWKRADVIKLSFLQPWKLNSSVWPTYWNICAEQGINTQLKISQ